MDSLETILPNVRRNVPLAPYTSLRIGGSADFLFEAKTTEEILSAVSAAQALNIPFVVLGGGSNVLISDNGFRGLVILVRTNGIEFQGEMVLAEAGVPMGLLVQKTTQAGLAGLEWAAGLPGTLGGAIYGNAGTFGREIKDVLSEITVLRNQAGQWQKLVLSAKEAKLAYRDSLFKTTKDIILQARLRLEKGDKEALENQVLKNIQYRAQHHPRYHSAGCIFKNAQTEFYQKAPMLTDGISLWFKRIPAGWLIDQADLKNFRVGRAVVSEKHGNFIINQNGARAEDVVILLSAIKNIVHKKFGVLLEEEIQYIGFSNPTKMANQTKSN